MKKALKVLAVVCASVLVTLIFLGVGMYLAFFRPMRADNFVVEIEAVTAEQIQYFIAELGHVYRDEQIGRAFFPSDDPNDYIQFHIFADIRNRSLHHSLLRPLPLEFTRFATIEILRMPERLWPGRQNRFYLGTVPVMYIGGLEPDEIEDYIRAIRFVQPMHRMIWLRAGDITIRNQVVLSLESTSFSQWQN